MKMQRDVSVNGDKERTAKGSQLTRVVPPSFSVPFIVMGVEGAVFFYAHRDFWQEDVKRKGEEKHGKGKVSKKYPTS